MIPENIVAMEMISIQNISILLCKVEDFIKNRRGGSPLEPPLKQGNAKSAEWKLTALDPLYRYMPGKV